MFPKALLLWVMRIASQRGKNGSLNQLPTHVSRLPIAAPVILPVARRVFSCPRVAWDLSLVALWLLEPKPTLPLRPMPPRQPSGLPTHGLRVHHLHCVERSPTSWLGQFVFTQPRLNVMLIEKLSLPFTTHPDNICGHLWLLQNFVPRPTFFLLATSCLNMEG